MPDEDRFSDATGAAPARSALRLRLALAAIGVLGFVLLAFLLYGLDAPGAVVVIPVVLAAVGVVDLVIVIVRLRSGAAGN
jgi:hypothetical protein